MGGLPTGSRTGAPELARSPSLPQPWPVGRARAVVTATGMNSEIGRIGRMVEGVQDEATPLERRLDLLGRRLVWFTLAIAALAGRSMRNVIRIA